MVSEFSIYLWSPLFPQISQVLVAISENVPGSLKTITGTVK
jgi:hypothetical protein